VPGFPPGGAYTVFPPGLLVMLALFTTAFAGFGLVEHIRSRLVERFLVTSASRLCILLALLARDVSVLIVQSIIALVMASCSYALASVINTVATPLLLLSGITLPLTLAPKIIQAIASVNPLAYEVTEARSLFLGNFADSSTTVSFALLGGLAVLAFWWAIRSLRKAAA